MKALYVHVLAPAGAILLFMINAALPVEVLGCVGRGVTALVIALASGLAGIVCGILAVRYSWNQDPRAKLWMLSTALLTVPVVLLLLWA